MTGPTGEWVTLSTPEFVGWTRYADVRLPFPLNTGELPYVKGIPPREHVARLLAQHRLDDSPVLAATKAVFAAPRLVVYVVRVSADAERRYVAIAGYGAEAVMVVLDEQRVDVRMIGETELVVSVIGALPRPPALPVPQVEVAKTALLEVDGAFAAGRPAAECRELMARAGYPAALAAFREQTVAAEATSGIFGVVGVDPDGALRPGPRAMAWKEYRNGALLHVERPGRSGETTVLLAPYIPDTVTRAGAELVAALYESGAR